MKKLLVVIILSFCAVYFHLRQNYWQKINPDNFVKTEAQAARILEAKNQLKMENTPDNNREDLQNAYLSRDKNASDIDFLSKSQTAD